MCHRLFHFLSSLSCNNFKQKAKDFNPKPNNYFSSQIIQEEEEEEEVFTLNKDENNYHDTNDNQTHPPQEIFQEVIFYSDTVPFIPPVTEGFVVKVYDGDTITIASKIPVPDSPLYRFPVRLSGIDCAEIKGSNADEKKMAIIARNELMNLIYQKKVTLQNIKTEKYGRILADIYLNDLHLNTYMLKNRLAVEYNGKTKKSPTSWMNYYMTGEL